MSTHIKTSEKCNFWRHCGSIKLILGSIESRLSIILTLKKWSKLTSQLFELYICYLFSIYGQHLDRWSMLICAQEQCLVVGGWSHWIHIWILHVMHMSLSNLIWKSISHTNDLQHRTKIVYISMTFGVRVFKNTHTICFFWVMPFRKNANCWRKKNITSRVALIICHWIYVAHLIFFFSHYFTQANLF